jgi:predicted amidohydrolase
MLTRVSLILCTGVLLMSSAAAAARNVTFSSVCLLSGKQYETRDYVLAQLAKVPAGADLVCLPHLPFLSFRGRSASRDLAPFAAFARERHCYLALSLMEQPLLEQPLLKTSEERTFATAVLLDRRGKLIGRYRKTHAFPDDREKLSLGAPSRSSRPTSARSA